jgi:hypothetical protein
MNKNYFEEVIDNLILDEVSEEDIRIKTKIKSLPNKLKRLAILSILDKDRGLYLKIKNLIEKNEVSKTIHIKNVVSMIREYVKVSDVEKKKYGEVMTPIELVEEMLDTLPKEVWTNPNLKWLDPANGIGVFPCIVVERLMEGLKEFEKDEELRYKHIVENMLYVCELQSKNMFLFLCAFDPEDKYLMNIYNGSFLEDGFDKHMKEINGVEKVDIIVGNPPYQDSDNTSTYGKLWTKFADKSLSITDKLCFVSPSTFLAKKDSERTSETTNLRNHIIHHCKLINTNINHYFDGIGSTFCFYFIDMNQINTQIKINNEFYNTSIFNNILPSTINKQTILIFQKVLNGNYFKKELKNGLVGNMIFDKELTDENKEIYKYRVQYADTTIKWSDKKHKLQDKIKCIFPSHTCRNIPILDNCISAPSVRGATYLFDNMFLAEQFIKYCNSKIIQFIIKEQRVHHGFLSITTVSSIPYIDLTQKWNNEKLYKYFNLTEEEIIFISK